MAFSLGTMYDYGEVYPRLKEALKWYKLSAERGNAKAPFNLGVMYYNGEGVPKDYKEAYAWWSVAKSNGHEVAAMNLGALEKEMTKEQIAEGMSLATEIYNRIEANAKD